MSTAVASSEHATSKPEVTPYTLALMAQKAIKDHQNRAETEAGLIRQLLIGRYVRVKDATPIWLVQEVRMANGWRAVLYGKSRGHRRKCVIGALADVEVIDMGGSK
jgi:hypothetical protein